ncbi:MAG: radical SAM protein [Desulfobacterales bacterium]|nr:MAG: radical SAM protein [Desulfobacterales bacterium]
MKVLTLNPPFLPKFSREQRSPAVTKSGTLYYPMWLSYATGVLEEDGFDVKLVDAPAQGQGIQDIMQFVKYFGPDLVVLDTSTPSIHNDVKVAARLKEILPSCITTLVGPHVSALPEETLKLDPAINVIARGEYDYTVRDLARAVERGRDFDQVEGISFRRNGHVLRTPDRPHIDDLDKLPLVSRVYHKHLNVRDYFYAICQYPEVTIITGRGCPHRCTYCVYPQVFQGRRYRARSAENVVDEFQYIAENFPFVKEVFIEDDTFTVDRRRCRQICEMLIEAKNKISWTANARADVDLETLRMMKAAGCRLLCVGVESGNQSILNNIKKGLSLKRITKFFEDAKKAGVLVHGCFLVGNRGENRRTLEETLDFSKALNPDTAQFFPLMVYPGTEAYNWAKGENLILTEDFSKWVTEEGLHNCVVELPGLSNADLVAFCDRARREFYLRPKYFISKSMQVLRHPSELKRTAKSMKTFFKYLLRGTFPEAESSCACPQAKPGANVGEACH